MSEQEVKELDLNGEMLVRREKLAALRKKGNAFPNQFRRDALAQDLHDKYEAEDGDRKSTRLNSSHDRQSRMPSSA